MGESRTQSVNLSARPKCTQTALGSRNAASKDGRWRGIETLLLFHTLETHTHTSIEREGKIERGKEGEAGCVLAVGCSFFSKAVTYTRALYLLAQGFYVGFFFGAISCM